MVALSVDLSTWGTYFLSGGGLLRLLLEVTRHLAHPGRILWIRAPRDPSRTTLVSVNTKTYGLNLL